MRDATCERVARDELCPEGRNKLKFDILAAVWVQEVSWRHEVWQDACYCTWSCSWIVFWPVLSCFACNSNVFKDFDLKFSVWVYLTMLLMWSSMIFVAVSQKSAIQGQTWPKWPKLVFCIFLCHFSSNWVEISCVIPEDPTLVDQVSDHPLKWLLWPCWTKSGQKTPNFQHRPIWLKIGGNLH